MKGKTMLKKYVFHVLEWLEKCLEKLYDHKWFVKLDNNTKTPLFVAIPISLFGGLIAGLLSGLSGVLAAGWPLSQIFNHRVFVVFMPVILIVMLIEVYILHRRNRKIKKMNGSQSA
ncbi:hypothetical protein HOE31_04875 [bacterium]|jgi:hypothetical protein|nr:hypothetical protein [bacterium]MBT4334857.1 hypothetical protein [bacterium]MBT4496024.1 hypothetical protein [bacterium]MBT4763835.1 hypothetical protein [bacterium]MBT5942835.1 hypothetical protein [bacterium]